MLAAPPSSTACPFLHSFRRSPLSGGSLRALLIARFGLALVLLAAGTLAAEEAPRAVSAGGPPPPTTSPPPPAWQPGAPGFDLSRHLKLDGQIRTRYELFDPFSYSTAGLNQADDYVLLRTRLGATFLLHPKLSVRIQIQDSRIWGEEGAATATSPVGSATTSIDNVDLHQAYVDVNHLFEDTLGQGTMSFRLGRQELSYGDQRLVSPLDWSNIARAWDALKIVIDPPGAPGGFKLDLFASVIRDTASANTGGGPVATAVNDLDSRQGFHGLYASFEDLHIAEGWTFQDPGGAALPVLRPHQLDLYAFYRDLSDDAFTAEDGKRGNVDEVTLGFRFAGKALTTQQGAGLDYSAELVGQVGKFAGDDLLAYGYALTGGYTTVLSSLDATKLRLGIEYDYGSGDDDPNDGDHGTFDPLFPFGHNYQGIQDTFSWKNGQDLAAKVEVALPKALRIPQVEVQYHAFWLSEDRDGWFNAGLAQIRRDPTGSAGSFVGTELDVTFKYVLVETYATIWAGYARFFPGDYVKDTGDAPDRDFAFAQLLVTF